jgi:hypothetical protein
MNPLAWLCGRMISQCTGAVCRLCADVGARDIAVPDDRDC